MRPPVSELRYNTLVNLPVVIPHILQACPDLDAEGVIDLVKERTGLGYLHPETVQDIRAIVLRVRLEVFAADEPSVHTVG